MKYDLFTNKTKKYAIWAASSLFAMLSLKAELPPLPAFIPDAPAMNKSLETYSAADVFSCVATGVLPEGHPLEEILTDAPIKLKSSWAGSKDSTQIDAMLNLVLASATEANKADVKQAFANIRFILYFIMQLTDQEKADAIVRVTELQTVPLKKRLMAEFAFVVYDDLYDARLLKYIVEYIDDATKNIIPPRREGDSIQTITDGSKIWGTLLTGLVEIGFDRVTLPTSTSNKAQDKLTLRNWMTANMTLISQKCATYKANPEFKVEPPRRRCWNAR